MSLPLFYEKLSNKINGKLAERVGFEPTIPGKRDTAFRERGLQPLGNLSGYPKRQRAGLVQYPFCFTVSMVSQAIIACDRHLARIGLDILSPGACNSVDWPLESIYQGFQGLIIP